MTAVFQKYYLSLQARSFPPGPLFLPASRRHEVARERNTNKVKINKNTERHILGSIGSNAPAAPCSRRAPWQVMG